MTMIYVMFCDCHILYYIMSTHLIPNKEYNLQNKEKIKIKIRK